MKCDCSYPQLPDMTKELLAEITLYYFKKWLSDKHKIQEIDLLTEDETHHLAQAILLHSFVDDVDLQNSENNPELVQMVVQINQAIADGKTLDWIEPIYQANKSHVIDSYQHQVEQFITSLLPSKKQEQILKLQSPEKVDVIEKIKHDYFKGNPDKQSAVNAARAEVENLKFQLDIFQPYRFEASFFAANPSFCMPFAYAVLHPEVWEPPMLRATLSGNQHHDFNWYLGENLPISDYRRVCNGLADSDLWNQQLYTAIAGIRTLLDNPMPVISKRREFITEIILNFEAARYEIAFIGIFVAIEGLLWDFGEFLNNSKKGIYDGSKQMIDDTTKQSFNSSRVRDLIERTRVKEYLDPKFLKYFCSELYDDRNLVLHGRGDCSRCPQLQKSLIYKFLVLHYILSKIDSLCGIEMMSSFDKIISPERTVQLLSTFYTS